MPKILALLTVVLAFSVPGTTRASGASTDPLELIESRLHAGRLHEADSLFQNMTSQGRSSPFPPPTSPVQRHQQHQRHLLEARFAAAQGNWRKTDALLRNWKTSPDRSEGSGEVLFWLGWSALHQGKKPEADSLFMLATAYAGEGSQQALEYRFLGLLESPPTLLDYLRGLPESPLPDSLRVTALERIPKTSRLYPYGQWQLALLLELMGDSTRARKALTDLASNPSSLPGRKAAARLSFQLEKTAPDSAKGGYEKLLLKQQQGVSAEFSRERLHELRKSP